MEIWKPVPGFEAYHISNTGNIKRIAGYDSAGLWRKERTLHPTPCGDKRNYYGTSLTVNGKSYHKRIHRLVAEAFIPNPDSLPHVNHKDGNGFNNHVDNLEWTTQQGNVRHAHETGLTQMRGEDNVKAKITEDDVREIRRLYNEEGMSKLAISRLYPISDAMVGNIVRGDNWTHI